VVRTRRPLGVLGAHLVALAWHGSADLVTQLTAAAVVALWVGSLLRDRRRRSSMVLRAAPPAATLSLG
jgi:hypothetical protein